MRERGGSGPLARRAGCALVVIVVMLVAGCTGVDGPALEPALTPPAGTTPPAAATRSPTAPDPPAATSQPMTTPPAAAGPDGWPPYTSTVAPVTAERLAGTWRPDCPVGPADLRLVTVTHATPDGGTAAGELVVAAAAANDVVAAFEEIYAARFPITRMTTIDAYGGDDDQSMAADNTSAFNCRAVTGGEGWSQHAYGLAIDINPVLNPYVRGDVVLPPAGQGYLDRSDVRPGMIVAGDVVFEAFTSRGFAWGGDFQTLKDYQHFAR